MARARYSRRQFLQTSSATAAAALTAPYWLTSAAAQEKKELRIGAIGVGGQGSWIAREAAKRGAILAVCDVDRERAEKFAGDEADIHGDYRRLLDRNDIDVVTIGTPDHWHTKIAIEALQSGKHVYCEKPLTLTIDEGDQICKAVAQTDKVLQVGTQQRSSADFQKAVGIARDGRLGKIVRITCAIGSGPKGGPFAESQPPPSLDWEMWLGQAPKVPYVKERCHYQFRWWFDYSGGKMTDWGAHHVDIAHWALGATDTGPRTIEGTATFPGIPGGYDTAVTFNVTCKFRDGAELVICDKTDAFDNGVLIEGQKDSIFVARGKLTGVQVDRLQDEPLPEALMSTLRKGKPAMSHMANFFECILNRGEPISDAFSHHRSLTSCHLANIAIRLGRPLQWDPEKQQIVGDSEAAAMQKRVQREPYVIKI